MVKIKKQLFSKNFYLFLKKVPQGLSFKSPKYQLDILSRGVQKDSIPF